MLLAISPSGPRWAAQNMRRTLALGTLVALLLTASRAVAQRRDDAAIFDVALSHFATEFESRQKRPANFLVFNETTVVLQEDLGFSATHLPEDLLKALVTSNATPRSLASYSPPPPYRVSTPELLGPALEAPPSGAVRLHYYNWEALHRQFPGVPGTLELALPVYSTDGATALVYFWTGIGSGGSGYLYLLEYSDGSWKVTKTFMPWVS
jgi:hypothetical protein